MNNASKRPAEKHRAALRTVWILATFAVLLFGATIYSFLK
jgi:hypothetical protein